MTDQTRAAREVAIRERLAKITPGPWKSLVNAKTCSICTADNPPHKPLYGQAVALCVRIDQRSQNNSAFIAAAPEDIAWLLTELDAQTVELKRAKDFVRRARVKGLLLDMDAEAAELLGNAHAG